MIKSPSPRTIKIVFFFGMLFYALLVTFVVYELVHIRYLTHLNVKNLSSKELSISAFLVLDYLILRYLKSKYYSQDNNKKPVTITNKWVLGFLSVFGLLTILALSSAD